MKATYKKSSPHRGKYRADKDTGTGVRGRKLSRAQINNKVWKENKIGVEIY